MIEQAIKMILEAEDNADKILSQAQKKIADEASKLDEEITALRVKSDIAVKTESNKIIEDAEKKGASDADKVLRTAFSDAETMIKKAEHGFSGAVDLLLELIVK